MELDFLPPEPDFFRGPQQLSFAALAPGVYVEHGTGLGKPLKGSVAVEKGYEDESRFFRRFFKGAGGQVQDVLYKDADVEVRLALQPALWRSKKLR